MNNITDVTLEITAHNAKSVTGWKKLQEQKKSHLFAEQSNYMEAKIGLTCKHTV